MNISWAYVAQIITWRLGGSFSLRQCYAAVFNMPMQNIKSSKGGSPQWCKLAQKKNSTSLICHKRLRKSPATPSRSSTCVFVAANSWCSDWWGKSIRYRRWISHEKNLHGQTKFPRARLTEGITSYTSTRKKIPPKMNSCHTWIYDSCLPLLTDTSRLCPDSCVWGSNLWSTTIKPKSGIKPPSPRNVDVEGQPQWESCHHQPSPPPLHPTWIRSSNLCEVPTPGHPKTFYTCEQWQQNPSVIPFLLVKNGIPRSWIIIIPNVWGG